MENKKLDQSLDTIMTDRKANNRRRSTRHANKKAKAAPVGGIHKTAAKPAKQGKAAAPPTKPVDGKVMISGLPTDVNEIELKDYIQKEVGPVKNLMLNYSAKGVSRGVAIVTFPKPEYCRKALEKISVLKVDNKPLAVDIIVDAAHAPAPEPTKSLTDRISKPKTDKEKPKPATAAKNGDDKKGGRGRGGGARGRGGRKSNTRNRPKTAEELDQEMTDYWSTTGGDAAMATNGGAAQPTAANGDTGMEDEIM